MPVAAVSALCLLAVVISLIFSTVLGFIKSAEPYKDALAKAAANPQVQAALGTPVTDGLIMTGQIRTSGPNGNASMIIPISGPKGKGDIYVEASKREGTWTYSTLEVGISGQPERILLPP